MGDEATENRTFEKFVFNGAVTYSSRPPRWWGYKGDAYYARRDAELRGQAEDSSAKTEGAFWVQQRTAHGGGQVRIKFGAGQNLFGYMTKWEMLHSTLFFGSNRSVAPIVDDACTLVAHVGWFRASQILIPAGIAPEMLDRLVDAGTPAFVKETNPMPAHYGTAYTGAPEMKYEVITDPEGQVLAVSGFDYGSGAESTTPPWEYIMIGKALITLVKTGVRVGVKALVRNATKQSVATGPTVRAAEKALLEAEQNAVKSAGKSAARTEAQAAAGRIAKQSRKVTTREMLEWEKQGGHTLEKHNPLLTRQNLKSRIIGKEEIPAPQIAKGSVRGKDMRIWQGAREEAASKWASEDVMHKSIGDAINKNLDTIRSAAKRGEKIVLEKIKTGYKTGAGWVTTSAKSAKLGTSLTSVAKGAVKEAAKEGEKEIVGNAMFYSEELTGVTIYIEPTTANAEGWFVKTAFPELVE